MSHLGDEPRQRGASTKSPTLPERVAQFYYAHGLFCSTYPTSVIFTALSIALLCCYPLINVPFPGNPPMEIRNLNTSSVQFSDQPWCYIQQVILKTAVIPWNEDLHIGDAFRAPLYEAFKLLDVVRNYQDSRSMKTLGHVCLHVEAIKKSKENKNNILPEYSCLVLSPANLWAQDVQQFSQDTSILNTIFSHQNLQKGKTSISEILFGMQLIDTGIKRYPLRNRQRILQYAITLFLKEYDEEFIAGLRYKLRTHYPLHQEFNNSDESSSSSKNNNTILIHYAGEIKYFEFVPLTITFILLFLYYYFSVRKMELIKSKLGMAFTTVATVLLSLSMTLGLCFFFGLTLSMQGKEVFPYLVILVGLENVLVLTKSVVSTPAHLDIKIRVAIGLSKEGWSITKNLLIEITIMTIGLFTFVPAIQEFCIFAIVGLITDFFLQMLLFSTILGIDTRRTENLAEKTNSSFRNTLYQPYYDQGFSAKSGLNRSKSHPRLNTLHTDIVAKAQSAQERKIPKRLRLVNIWARTRFFQRAFSVLMVVWISMILYNSGVIEHYFLDLNERMETSNASDFKTKSDRNYTSPINLLPILNVSDYTIKFDPQNIMLQHNNTDEINKLKHPDFAPWLRLSTQHWSSILGRYNISLSGRTVAILPGITISQVVTPEQAELLRNPSDKYRQKFQWQALAAALDPIDFRDMEVSGSNYHQSDRPFYPTSPMEIFLTTILCVISVLVLAYAFVVLYKCICSRNYAEWRASWTSEKTEEREIPLLLEAVPVVLEGHQQEIECVATDGFSIVSSCLGGQLKVWDSITGELLAHIDRHSSSKPQEFNMEYDENNFSDYESGSPPSRDETFLSFPSLQHKINTNFSNFKLTSTPNKEYTKFDFGNQYREIYKNYDKEIRLRQRSCETVKWVNCQRTPCEFHNCDEKKIFCELPKTRSCEGLSDNTNSSSPSLCCTFSVSAPSNVSENFKSSPIWCLDYLDNLIAIGCANGRLEFWEGTTGKLKCMFEDGSGVGITNIKLVGSRVIVARLYGTLDLFQLQTYSQGRPIDWNFTSAYRRTHVRTGSTGSITDYKDVEQEENKEDMRCLKVASTRVHQQPITCLDSEGSRIVTGSQDHTLKVFRLEDGSPLYTLHGHYGPITCLFIDRVCPATSGSGSQDGMLCVWDLLTGACMYSIQAHDGSITSLTYSSSYVISLGSDGRLCVWERFQGHLLNTIQISHTFTSQVLMLSPHLLITARSGGLVIYDVQTGENIRTIALGHSSMVFIKQLLMLRDAVMCDFGNQLRIVRFPLITHKSD